jgi:chromosome segregation ATPase
VGQTENYKALENLKEYENISKLDANFNTMTLGMSKKGGMMMGALGSTLMNKHNQLKSMNQQSIESSQAEFNELQSQNSSLQKQVKDLETKITELLSKKTSKNEQLDDEKQQQELRMFDLEQKIEMQEVEKENAMSQETQLRQELQKAHAETLKKVN